MAGPWLFGLLIGSGERSSIAWGYVFGASLMLVAAAIQWRWGLAAERRSLEDVAAPLSSAGPVSGAAVSTDGIARDETATDEASTDTSQGRRRDH